MPLVRTSYVARASLLAHSHPSQLVRIPYPAASVPCNQLPPRNPEPAFCAFNSPPACKNPAASPVSSLATGTHPARSSRTAANPLESPAPRFHPQFVARIPCSQLVPRTWHAWVPISRSTPYSKMLAFRAANLHPVRSILHAGLILQQAARVSHHQFRLRTCLPQVACAWLPAHSWPS